MPSSTATPASDRITRRARSRVSMLLALAGACLAMPACAAPSGGRARGAGDDRAEAAYGRRADVLALAAAIAESSGLDRGAVEATLAEARFIPSVQRLMQPAPAGSTKNWAAYRARFVEPTRLRAGVAFLRENERALVEAEARFGVPAAIVVGIVGVETLYGRHMGNYRVLDALATLSLDFPATPRRDRSAFFRDELAQFLLLCREQNDDPLAVLGSYAGAMGLPQFMPSSRRKHAIDFDGDGRIDLHQSPADAIGSVANFLVNHGWQRGMPTHHEVTVPQATADRAVLLLPDIVPSFTAAQFAERGAGLDAAGREHAGPLALVELQNGDAAPSYVAGTQNFYALTRYNASSYYAMAVIELGRTVLTVAEAAR
ncbi:MAG TPA: lytic murein transglycosylase B [Methylibium sp.]|uniref:lytic murein transglycosylase B n=1 Tax=Methylibium sp. TaxID=2067992 RepID=UPI002DBB0BD7|nr:lytic murein transglycosylase B [Methylibium sp.]HEU4459076.1 lytic murein transglycosylase B [Methylibium sp.]